MAHSEFSSINIKASAKERDAFNIGAQSKRAGTYIAKGREWYLKTEQNLISWFERGFKAQQSRPDLKITFAGYYHLLNEAGRVTVDPANHAEKEIAMKTRTAEEIAALSAAYRTEVYDAYAAEQASQGFEPQSFDEAFSAHLAALDATDDGAAAGTAATDAAKPETAKARKAREVEERKAKREADKKAADEAKAKAKADKDAAAAKAQADKAASKPAAEAKAKKFRPTSEDRVTIMNAAKKLVADGETPRLKLADGNPYDDFLKGVQMTVDGAAEVTFNVYTAKALRADKPEASGQLKATVEGGKLAKVVKA